MVNVNLHDRQRSPNEGREKGKTDLRNRNPRASPPLSQVTLDRSSVLDLVQLDRLGHGTVATGLEEGRGLLAVGTVSLGEDGDAGRGDEVLRRECERVYRMRGLALELLLWYERTSTVDLAAASWSGLISAGENACLMALKMDCIEGR